MPDLTPATTYLELVEPTWTHTDGRRTWRLTEDVRVTIYPDEQINVTDRARRLFNVRNWPTRRGTEVHLVPRPDAAG